jgi:Ca2+-binding RTX toxin-like protein
VDTVYISLSSTLNVTFNSATYAYGQYDMSLIQILGHDNNDTVTTANAVQCAMAVFGGPGDDAITTGSGADYIDGGLGADTIHGGAGNDFLDGNDGDDFLYGDAGDDVIHGGLGDDYADGGDEDDMIYGDEGSDTLFGAGGYDWIEGGDGNDTLLGGALNDVLLGDAGDDWLYGDQQQSTDIGHDVLVGGDGADYLYAGVGSAELYGGPGNDMLYGSYGFDTLRGGDGNDYLYGGAGDDDLDGEDGADTLNGGAGYNDPMYVDGSPQGQQYWNYFTDGGYGDTYAVSATEQYRPYYSWGAAGATYPPYQEVFVTWVPRGDLGTAVPYNVHHAEGQSDAITVNQQDPPPGSVPDDPLPWQSLGVYEAAQSVEVNGHNPSPYPRTCVDAVLLRGVDPICDLLTDSNNDGSINADDDPIEGDPIGGMSAGPGRIVAIGSSTRTEVKLHAAAVDANLSCPQHWWAQLRFPSGLKVWENPVGAPELTTNTTREITANGPWDTSVWIEGVTAGTASLQLELFSHPGDPEEERLYCWKDAVKFSVVDADIDLDVYMIDHNIAGECLPDAQEEDPGAWVPLNNDADAYDHYNGTSKDDRNAGFWGIPGPIPGEDDLLPIVLHHVDAGGWYKVHVPANVRVWETPYRTGFVSDVRKLSATADRTLYVEGIAQGSGVITVDWGYGWFTLLPVADSVKVNVFEWTGPLNVPDYSIQKYQALGGRPGECAWLDPVGGTVASRSTAPPDNLFVDVKWWGGPQVGEAVYQASADYSWGLKVNVVQVLVADPDSGPAFTPNPNGVRARVEGPSPLMEHVYTATVAEQKPQPDGQGAGMLFRAKVTLTGPDPTIPLGGRGVRWVKGGFIQEASTIQDRGHYMPGNFDVAWTTEGTTYLDSSEDPEIGDHLPWYGRPQNVGDPYIDRALGDGPVKEIWSWDSPASRLPLWWGSSRISQTLANYTFHDYVVAITTDPRAITDFYSVHADAIWAFDGGGNLAPLPNLPTWTRTTAGVTVVRGWSPVAPWTEPPHAHDTITADQAAANAQPRRIN